MCAHRNLWQTVRDRWARTGPASRPSGVTTDLSTTPPHGPLGELVRAGSRVDLRRHTPAHREPFVRWYQDDEIAEMLRHDLSPLTANQAGNYFDSIILPATGRGTCWAIHEHDSGRLVGSTALVDVDEITRSSLFRIVIGEKDTWGQGFGTEATDLVLAEAFLRIGLQCVKLEVFQHNPRAQRAYVRAGFRETGRHVEWVSRARRQIDVVEMAINRQEWLERAQSTE